MKTPEVSMMEIDEDPFEQYPDMDDIDARLAIERSALLCLPAEVLQLVLLNMDTATYFTSLLVCKTVLQAAQSRRVIFHHLNRLPGLRLGLDCLNNVELLWSFRKRAAKGLCAAGMLADITRYAPSDNLVLSKTIFHPGEILWMATAHEHGVVNIYELSGEKQVRQKAELRTQTLYDDELRQHYRMEVVKMAFSGHKDLAVLCRTRKSKKRVWPSSTPSVGSDSSDDEAEPAPIDRFKLVTFHYCQSKQKGHFYSSDLQETREISRPLNREPVGLALASNGTACITWKKYSDKTDVYIYARNAARMAEASYDPAPSTLEFDERCHRTTDMDRKRLIYTPHFGSSDKVLNFHFPGEPIHRWYTHSVHPLAQHSGPVHSNKEWLDIDGNEVLTSFSIGIPFHGAHYPSIAVDYTDAFMCRTSYLAVAVHIGDTSDEPHEIAFIVQCDHDSAPAACTHQVDLHAGRRHSSWCPWRPLALLAGYRQGASSLGTILSISPQGTHIAAATWNSILIWSLDPSLLLEGALGQYFPRVDYNARKQFGRLRPVKLRPEGVVHSLCWASETVLWAVTDQAVVKWDCGHLAGGERQEVALPCDAPGMYAFSMAQGGWS